MLLYTITVNFVLILCQYEINYNYYKYYKTYFYNMMNKLILLVFTDNY